MACAVLAADPSLRGESDGTNPMLDAETEQRRTKLANACRLLEKAGEKNPMAQVMVRRLVGVLRKHRIHGVQDDKGGPLTVQETEALTSSVPLVHSAQAYSTMQNRPDRQGLAGDHLRPIPSQQQQQQLEGQDSVDDPMNPNALVGIWNDFLGTDPTNNGWEQLFADLDYLNGGM